MNVNKFDVIIIGGGPAGVSAALYTARSGLSTAVVHNGSGALGRTERIQNYYGTGEISGGELYARGLAQAASVGASVIEEQVTFVQADGRKFTVYTPNGELESQFLVIATGSERKTVNISGLREYEGKGVSYCAVCDAFFYRKKRVGVIGAGEYAEHEYTVLNGVAEKAYLLTNGEKPTFVAENTVTDRIARVVGKDGRVCGVELENGETVELDGLFVALGFLGGAGIAKSLGIFTDANGAIEVDGNGMTNMKNLYAAGDCTNGIKQVAKAVYEGMNVGLAVVKEYRNNQK